MNDWESKRVWKGEWDEKPAHFEPLYPEGTIPEDMSLREYGEIQADYIKETEGKASLNPVIVMQWWAERSLDTRPLSYQIDPHEVEENWRDMTMGNPDDESELY